MSAEFTKAEPARDAASDGPLDGGDIGELKMFDAHSADGKDSPRIKITYGTYRIYCRRVIFQRSDGSEGSEDLAVLYGNLQDQPPADVEIINEDFQRPSFTQMHNSRILWRPKTNRFEAIGVRVRAMR